MVEIKRILCPVDFSDFSRHALEHAVALARWYESEITVFHAYQSSMPPILLGSYPGPMLLEPTATPPQGIYDGIVAELTRFTDAVKSSGVPLRLEARECRAGEGILTIATSLPADLIVMGTHGRSGLDRLVLGSVTEKVLRKASCPVLTVPPPVSGAPTAAPVLFERILCPVDFSDASMKALTYALSLAQEADARLLLVHVVERVPVWDEEMYAGLDIAGYQQALADDALTRLRKAIPDEARSVCQPEELVTTGKPYREILRVARERDVHLIVMGVQGRNPLDLTLFGSTTHHIVREAACPVLTLRS